MRCLFSSFCLEHCKGKKDYLEKQDVSRTDKTSSHFVVSMLCIFNFPYYEETCLKIVVICIMLEKPLHGNEQLMQLYEEAQLKKKVQG